MSIEDYKRHLDAQALQSHGKLSPSRELLEQLIDMVFRLDREAYLGGGTDHRAGDISGYRLGYNPDDATNASCSLNLQPSQISSSVNTPLYASTFNRRQRSSEALQNVAAECYIEGVSAPEVSKIFSLFGVEKITSTQKSNTSKKLDDGLKPQRSINLGEFPSPQSGSDAE